MKEEGITIMTNTLEEKIQKLPPERQQEVEAIVDGFLQQPEPVAHPQFKFDWEGSIKDLRDTYTSVELQHKALEWWGD